MISDARASCGDGVNKTEWGVFFLKQKKKTIFWSIGFQLRWQRRKDPALEEVAEEAEKIVVIDWDCRVPRKRFKRMLGGAMLGIVDLFEAPNTIIILLGQEQQDYDGRKYQVHWIEKWILKRKTLGGGHFTSQYQEGVGAKEQACGFEFRRRLVRW